jgi:hypothetical protein
MMTSLPFVFAYFSPETVLPLTSVLASAVGVLLLFGRGSLRLVRRLLRIAIPRGRRASVVPMPHFIFSKESVATAPQSTLPDHDSATTKLSATGDPQ